MTKNFKLIFLNVWPFLINFFSSHEEPNSIKFQEISPFQFPFNPRAPLKNITNHNWSVKIRFSADEKKNRLKCLMHAFQTKYTPMHPHSNEKKNSCFKAVKWNPNTRNNNSNSRQKGKATTIKLIRVEQTKNPSRLNEIIII